jgi:hypothetical protein
MGPKRRVPVWRVAGAVWHARARDRRPFHLAPLAV